MLLQEENEMNSFIGWVGGKSRLKKYIIPLIPKDVERYIEVFGGAGWVFFAKPPHKIEVFNDIDGNLINLYRQIKNNCDALQAEIDWLQSRELFYDYRKQIEEQVNLTDIQRAAQYFYLIKISFGSTKSSFATAPKGTYKIIEQLPQYKERLRKTIIENRDFEQLIKVYDRENALFYLDPPYVDTEKYYTAADFKTSDHNRLKAVLSTIKGRFILSYNDCDFVRNLYKEYKIRSVDRINLLSANANNRKTFRELIITNY